MNARGLDSNGRTLLHGGDAVRVSALLIEGADDNAITYDGTEGKVAGVNDDGTINVHFASLKRTVCFRRVSLRKVGSGQRGAAEGSTVAAMLGVSSLLVAAASAWPWLLAIVVAAVGGFLLGKRRALARMRFDFNRYLRVVGPDRKVRDLIKKMQLDQAAAARRASKRAQRGDSDVGMLGIVVGALLIAFAIGSVVSDRRHARELAPLSGGVVFVAVPSQADGGR